jgi:predicted transcriptional regulator
MKEHPMAETETPDLTTLTVQLLSAYVSNNQVPSAELAGLIQTTRTALSGDVAAVEPAAPEFAPATTARKSLASRDHIVSMIDGKPYKTLKRHLSTNGLTPAEYRERYKLPKDYPMVAPGYSEQRREVAKRLGLGRKPAAAAVESIAAPAGPVEQAAAPVEPVTVAPPAKKSRTAKAKSGAASKSAQPKQVRKPGKAASPALATDDGEAAAATKPVRGRRAKAAPAASEPTPSPAAPKVRRGRKAAPEVAAEPS